MGVATQVQLTFDVLVPFAVAAFGVCWPVIGRRWPASRGLLVDFVDVDDERADAQLDLIPAPVPQLPVEAAARDPRSSEETPLLWNEEDARQVAQPNLKLANGRPTKRAALAALGLAGLATRIAIVFYDKRKGDDGRAGSLLIDFAVLATWLYASFQPLLSAACTPSYTLLAIYSSSLLSALGNLTLLLIPGTDALRGRDPQWQVESFLRVVHPILCLFALSVLLNMPLRDPNGLPSTNSGHSAHEESATLGQWLTFSFLGPLVRQGKTTPLEERDVWKLALNLRSRLLQRKFEFVEGRSLMARLFKANARDLIITALLMLLSAVLQLAQPILLSRILAAIEIAQYSGPDSDPLVFFPATHHSAYRAWNPAYYLPVALTEFSFGRSTSGVPYNNALDAGDGEAAQRSSRQVAYILTVVAFVVQIFKGEVDLQAMYIGRRATVRAKSEAISSIFAKALKRVDTSGSVGTTHSGESEGEKGTGAKVETAGSSDMGKITSLVATDANRIGMFTEYYSQLVQTPLSVLLAAWFLYALMGWSAFAGYAAFLLAIPANHFVMKWQYKLLHHVMEMRDRRMRSMNEVIQAIKYIKFSAWESRWSQRVLDHRERELRQVLKLKIAQFLVNFVWNVVPILVACISLTTFTYVAHRELSVAIAFPALLTFQILTSELTTLPLLASWLQGVYASVQRIDEFLEEEEVPESVRGQNQDIKSQDIDTRIGCDAATFVWNTTAMKEDTLLTQQLQMAANPALAKRRSWVQMLTWRRNQPIALPADLPSTPIAYSESMQRGPNIFALRDITVNFPRSKLSLIYGPTGSGKSSLLAALLGEMKCLEGKVYLPKYSMRVDPSSGMKETISFCAQQPWLEHQTVRENILFGTPYDQARYNAVLSACALTQDLKILQDGDRTEIGDKGLSLSGGQKARIALARAIYAYTKTVILDDVLSAVDTHTASHIISRCFLGPLMKDRTLILVTHHVHSVIDHCAYVVRMDNGAVDAQGTPAQLRASGHLSLTVRTPRNSIFDEDLGADTDDEVERPDGEEPYHLVENEYKAQGSVKYTIYRIYLRAAGYIVVAVLFGAIFLQRAGDLGQKVWVKAWSESYEGHGTKPPFGLPSPAENPLPYITIYVCIQSLNALSSVIAQIPNIYGSLRASRKLYTRMLDSVLRAPARWFDRTPAGRILNRFAKDIDIVDTGLADHVRLVGDQLFTFIIAVCTIAYGIPWFLPAAVVIGYLHYYYANGYIKTSRDLNRLESVLRSPIISTFGELLIGVSTVRAFGHEQRFMYALYERLDKCQAAFYYTWMTNYWLRFRFAILGAVTFGCTSVLAIFLNVRAGLAAIIITQSQIVLGAIYWGMHSYIGAEQAFNGVERIAEYMDLPSEPPRIMDSRPPAGWPSDDGGIEFSDVVIKYAENLDPVLRHVTFKIKPGEKIGLCGRTGSGKSTLALSLFRFVDPTGGKIIIDGVDITSIGVDDLRSQLTLISQDAVLFSGTVRDNLDPFHEYTDAECLEVLRKVQLPVDVLAHAPISSRLAQSALPSGATTPCPDTRSRLTVRLDSRVSEGGNNWSAGQRQLIAMARALLRKTRIVVLDESTASVDFETDRKIQHTIREGFEDSIMLIIAHRLHTIIECDRVMVLDAGRVVEFDTPKALLHKEGGAFRHMCEKSGSIESLRAATN